VTADEKTTRQSAARDGVWVAHTESGTTVAIFSTKLAALEFAVDQGLKTRRVQYGQDLRDQTEAT
jgi:hypothetical protein